MIDLFQCIKIANSNQFYQMITRSRSFSKGGANIERVLEIERYKIDKHQLNKILHSNTKKIDVLKRQKKQPVVMQGFDKIPGREKPSPFLLHEVKDTNAHLDYVYKPDMLLTKAASFPIRQEKDERLSELLQSSKQQQTYKDEHHETDKCKKFQTCENQLIKTPKDLLSGRKTFHHIDFEKQTNRPFDQKLKKISMEKDIQANFLRTNSVGTLTSYQQNSNENIMLKTHKVHSFASYTKREFLTEKQVRGAPEVSGIQSFKINPQKFKSQWKTIDPPRFDKVAKKTLSRYDRDCPHWFTQLHYNVKNGHKSVKSHLDFQSQTFRKINQVKSSYPIRIAI